MFISNDAPATAPFPIQLCVVKAFPLDQHNDRLVLQGARNNPRHLPQHRTKATGAIELCEHVEVMIKPYKAKQLYL